MGIQLLGGIEVEELLTITQLQVGVSIRVCVPPIFAFVLSIVQQRQSPFREIMIHSTCFDIECLFFLTHALVQTLELAPEPPVPELNNYL